MKILVVEDDPVVARTLELLLSSYSYAVDVAIDGETGLQMINAFDYDLILLDVVLPGLDGVSLCRTLRAQGLKTPILLLTGREGSHQKAVALNAGADDYVVKPFDPEELIARLQALLRRGHLTSQPVLSWGNLSINPGSHQVNYGTYLLPVTPKEYAILELFLRNPQHTFSLQVMLDHIWNSAESPGREAVRVHIKELRQKLQTVGAPKDLIKTVHGIGYRLNPAYSSALANQSEQPLTTQQFAEIRSVNEELRLTLEKLQIAQAELQQQTEQLESAQRTIATERQRYQDLFEFAPDAYLVTNLPGVIQEANRAASELFHCEIRRLIGKPLAVFIAQSDRPAFNRQLANLDFGQNWEVNIKPRQSHSFPVLITVTSIKNLQNEIAGLRWSLCDIRSHKEMEQQLKTIRSELERRVAERTAELMATNQSLQQQQHQWQALFEYALDAITITDDEGQYIDVNPAACQLFGVSREELLRSRVANFANPELDITSVWQQFLQQGQMAGEFRLYRPDGTIRDTEFAAIANFIPGRHLSILRDISDRKRSETERKHAEDELRKQEEFLRSIYNGADQGIFVIDVNEANNFHYMSFNRIAEEFAGFSEQELRGKTPEEAFGAITGAAFRQNYNRCLQTGKSIRYEEHVALEKHTIWTLTTLSPLRNQQGNIYRIVGTVIDITDRKLAEQKIQEQAALLDITSDAIFVRDLNHRILYWNQGAARLYGWKASEAIGRVAYELLQNDVSQVSEIMSLLLQQGKWRGEIRKTTTTGREVIVEARWTLVRDEANQPKFILSVDTDITEKKHLEVQFYRAQRLESLGTLASGIAHDLNNVLTPVLTIAQLLRIQHANLDGRSQEMLNLLEESSKRGANMVKQILTFARGTGGKRTSLKVAPLLEEVVTVIRQTFPKSITIRANIPNQPLGLVSADPTHLHQVLMNFCVNARDAMPDGGVLTLTAENFVIDEIFAYMNLDAQVGNYVLITVTDTGTGIAPELRDRIFDPFFTTKEPGRGKGLVLSTALGIVRDYGGFVQVFSEVGQGSQFRVYLPTIVETSNEAEQTRAVLEGNGELVLIVDDDIAVQQANKTLLETYHYTTLVANDGREAIDLYTQHQDQIKVVLMDMMMPNMDGISAVRHLRQINPTVKIIAISGLTSNREAVLAAGANVFLSKPYIVEELLRHFHVLTRA